MLTMFDELIQYFVKNKDGSYVYYIDGYFLDSESDEIVSVAEIIVKGENIKVLYMEYNYIKDAYVSNVIEKTISEIKNNEK